jgi:hypothetical protein
LSKGKDIVFHYKNFPREPSIQVFSSANKGIDVLRSCLALILAKALGRQKFDGVGDRKRRNKGVIFRAPEPSIL